MRASNRGANSIHLRGNPTALEPIGAVESNGIANGIANSEIDISNGISNGIDEP